MYTYRIESLTDSVKRVLLQLDNRFSPKLMARLLVPVPIPSFLSSVLQGRPLAIVGSESSLDRLSLNILARINRMPLEPLLSGQFDKDWWQPLCNSIEIIKAAMPSKMIVAYRENHCSNSIPDLTNTVEGFVIDSMLNVRLVEKHLQSKNTLPIVARSFYPKPATANWNGHRRVPMDSVETVLKATHS